MNKNSFLLLKYQKQCFDIKSSNMTPLRHSEEKDKTFPRESPLYKFNANFSPNQKQLNKQNEIITEGYT